MQFEIGNISTECCHQGESIKKCEQTLLFIAMHCWGYMSLEVKGQWGLLYFLITVIQQSGTSSSSSWLKCSSKGIIYIWRASITSSSCPTHDPLLISSLDQVVNLYCLLLHYSHSFLTGIMVCTGVMRRPGKRTNLHQPLTFNGMHYKKRLVVLTTERLSWLHGSLLCQRLNVKGTKEVVSLFLLFSLFQNEERGGNNKCLIQY